jgi:hypothetical protein
MPVIPDALRSVLNNDETWIIEVRDDRDGYRARTVLPADGGPGWMVDELDANGYPVPDAPMAYYLDPEEVRWWRAVIKGGWAMVLESMERERDRRQRETEGQPAE